MCGNELGLIESPRAFARPMQWDRNDEAALEIFPFKAFFENAAKWIRERDAIRILQIVDDLPKGRGKEKRRACEVERVFALSTASTETFDSRSRFAALRAVGWLERHEARPAFRTCPSPPALRNLSGAYTARDWQQEIENEIEQSAFGETQRAKTVYKILFLLRIGKIVNDRERAVKLFKEQNAGEIVGKCQR